VVLTVEKSEFAGRRIAVLGMARTGLAAAPVLMELGAQVILSDSAGAERLGDRLDMARETGAEVRINSDPETALFGADLVIPSPGIPMDAPVLRLARVWDIPILSEIEVAYRICRAPILAVTGTNGKTTTTLWLGEMLREAGWRTWVAGNVSADEVKQTLITAAARAYPDDAIVAEVSSFQLEWVEEFRPKVGILTNITPDHMNRHKSFAEYAECKARLIASQRAGDVAVVNAVNAPSRAIGERAPGRLFWFDRGHCQKDDSACVRGGWITVRWSGEEYALCRVDELKLPGTHNVENALAAAGAAIAFGADPNAVEKALREFGGVVHRMERVAEIGGVLYINNSMCTNVDAAVRSLEAMDRPTVVIAGGADKNSDFAPLGAAIARQARQLVLIGQAAEAIERAAREAGFEAVTRADSMEEAVAAAERIARPGDAVMLSPACASFDMFADFEARGEAFRQAVRRRMKDEG
jgi:UDP-N-acetylmuramoylalanine--D-glutamate ligase